MLAMLSRERGSPASGSGRELERDETEPPAGALCSRLLLPRAYVEHFLLYEPTTLPAELPSPGSLQTLHIYSPIRYSIVCKSP
jgi:hypothetical protein